MDQREKKIYKVTLVGTAVNALLIVFKFVAGILGHSSALVADAVHSLTDFITDVIVLVFVKISGKPLDRGHAYGHGKFETFATMIIGLILAVAGLALGINGVVDTIECFRGNQPPSPTMAALIVAILSIVSKEWLYRYTDKWGRQLNSQAVVANAWHHRSDAISSFGTLIGIAGAMFLGDRWHFLDPLAAVIVSFFIIKAGYDIMRPSISELLEAALPQDVENEITATILSIHGIDALHRLRTRRIGNTIAIDVHAKMDGNMSLSQAHTLATEAEEKLREKYGASTLVNIHMEPSVIGSL